MSVSVTVQTSSSAFEVISELCKFLTHVMVGHVAQSSSVFEIINKWMQDLDPLVQMYGFLMVSRPADITQGSAEAHGL